MMPLGTWDYFCGFVCEADGWGIHQIGNRTFRAKVGVTVEGGRFGQPIDSALESSNIYMQVSNAQQGIIPFLKSIMLKLLHTQQHTLLSHHVVPMVIRSSHTVAQKMPKDLLRELQANQTVPMRTEFCGSKRLTTDDLENLSIDQGRHHEPKTMGDRFALRLVKTLRLLPDTYFGGDHYMRAVMLETIAAGKCLLKVCIMSNIDHY